LTGSVNGRMSKGGFVHHTLNRMSWYLGLALVLCTYGVSVDRVAAQSAEAPGRMNSGSGQDVRKGATALDAEASWDHASAKETESVTSHSISLGNRALHYRATAGTLTILDDSDKPAASIFYVAYCLDEQSIAKPRPVMFFFNGGPGASSVGLHLASFAPVRIHTGDPGYIPPAPYVYGPNAHTLLDKTDMVFLDAIGTGYSRALGENSSKAFWSTDADVDAFAKAITRYTTKNARWNSPKLLFGESYGTARAAMVAYRLQQNNVALNGVVLLSSVLNHHVPHSGDLESYIGILPSYAAAAYYHHKVTSPPADFSKFLQSVETFAVGPYAALLAKGQRASDQERNEVANQMSAFTGLSADFIIQSNFRLGWGRFQKELLRDKRRTVGTFDARYTGVDTEPEGPTPSYDQLENSLSGALVAMFNDYIVRELHYKTDMPYRTDPHEINRSWDWSHKGPSADYAHEHWPYAALDLAAAMRINPDLRVLSLSGYYDLATPFFTTEYELSQMMLEPELQKNLQLRTYPSGHVAYVNPEVLATMHDDIAQLIDEATTGER
jgi:carboxypeptidase C (cathepsin A)